MRDFLEDFLVPFSGIVGVVVGGIFTLVCGINVIQYVWEKDQCSRYAQLTGAQTYYAWSTPCYVKAKDGRWLTLDTVTKNSTDLTVREGK